MSSVVSDAQAEALRLLNGEYNAMLLADDDADANALLELERKIDERANRLERLVSVNKLLVVAGALGAVAITPPRSSSARLPQLPHGMKTFKRSTVSDPTNASNFITAVERLLRANGYPTDKYTIALVAYCCADEADWAEKNIVEKNLSWSDAKKDFLAHFVSQDIVGAERQKLAETQMIPWEHPAAFADRYAQQMEKAQVSLQEKTHTYQLEAKLPDEIKMALKIVQLSKPGAVDTPAGLIVAINTLYPPESESYQQRPAARRVAQPDMDAALGTAAKPATNLWCDSHRVRSHGNDTCSAPDQFKIEAADAARKVARTMSVYKEPVRIASAYPVAPNQSVDRVPFNQPARPSNTTSGVNQHYRIKCYGCQEFGHIKAHCPKAIASIPTQHHADADYHYQVDDTSPEEGEFLAIDTMDQWQEYFGDQSPPSPFGDA
jgi:hypothetical protein